MRFPSTPRSLCFPADCFWAAGSACASAVFRPRCIGQECCLAPQAGVFSVSGCTFYSLGKKSPYGGIFINYNLEREESVWGACGCRALVSLALIRGTLP